MYVRWKRKRLTRRDPRWSTEDPGVSLTAVLVESRRVDGRPRQQYVKHLGAIPEQKIAFGFWPIGFWRSVDAALASLALTDDERERLAAAVAVRVPRPSVERLAQLSAELASREASIARAR